MPKITLLDGTIKNYNAPITPIEIASEISISLSKKVFFVKEVAIKTHADCQEVVTEVQCQLCRPLSRRLDHSRCLLVISCRLLPSRSDFARRLSLSLSQGSSHSCGCSNEIPFNSQPTANELRKMLSSPSRPCTRSS